MYTKNRSRVDVCLSTKEKIKPGRGIETAQADMLNFQVARRGGTRKWKTIMAVCELQVQRH